MLKSKNRGFNPYFNRYLSNEKNTFVDNSRVEGTVFLVEKLSFSLKLFLSIFMGNPSLRLFEVLSDFPMHVEGMEVHVLTLACWEIMHSFLLLADFILKLTFWTNYFRHTIKLFAKVICRRHQQTKSSRYTEYMQSTDHHQLAFVGVAPITHYTHLPNKNSNTQGSSPYVVKVIFHTLRNCS